MTPWGCHWSASLVKGHTSSKADRAYASLCKLEKSILPQVKNAWLDGEEEGGVQLPLGHICSGTNCPATCSSHQNYPLRNKRSTLASVAFHGQPSPDSPAQSLIPLATNPRTSRREFQACPHFLMFVLLVRLFPLAIMP